MYFDGRDTFWGIDCIFIGNSDGMDIYPINNHERLSLISHIKEIDVSLPFHCEMFHNSIINVHRIGHASTNGYKLFANYIINRLNTAPISVIEITADAIDSLFSPVRYFLQQKKQGKELTTNLLYNAEKADTWSIIHKDQKIDISLLYGEILIKGSASDMKIHPKIRISFKETDCAEDIYEIYKIIKLFLQISRYGLNIGKPHVDLYASIGGSISHQGYLFDYNQSEPKCTYSDMIYPFIKNNIGSLLQFASDNQTLLIDFFPNKYFDISGKGCDSQLFASLFAAFERECHENEDLYIKTDDSQIREKKDELIKYIKSERVKNSEFSWFYQGIEERINQFGTQIGQCRKITNAYNTLSESLQESMQQVFFYSNIKIQQYPTKKEINKIADEIMQLRGKVLHDGTKNSFSNEEIPYVRFLEILVYSMMLKRADIPNKSIESIIGVIFHCNTIAIETLLHKEV